VDDLNRRENHTNPLTLIVFVPITVHLFVILPVLSLRTTPQAKPDELTAEEEDILFGDDPHPPFPSRHRRKDRNGNFLEDKTLKLDGLDHSTTNPMVNKLHTLRDKLEFCPQLWTEMGQINPQGIALIDDHLCDDKIRVTFSQMDEIIRTSAAIFQRFGVQPGTNVAIFAENSARWLMADHGIQRAGGASAVRGADAPLDELRYIYDHSDSAGIVVLQGPKLLKQLQKDAKQRGMTKLGLKNDKYGSVKHILLLTREKTSPQEIQELSEQLGIDIQAFGDLLDKTGLISDSQLPVLKKTDLATIVYTSGTTGQPKGVMLTHGNLLHQISHRLSTTRPYEETEPLPGETMVSLLPVRFILPCMIFCVFACVHGSHTIVLSVSSTIY
jgi:long-chain acyl-CoA synthetase